MNKPITGPQKRIDKKDLQVDEVVQPKRSEIKITSKETKHEKKYKPYKLGRILWIVATIAVVIFAAKPLIKHSNNHKVTIKFQNRRSHLKIVF